MTWWPLAWSEELRSEPKAVRVADEELVLFRDRDGIAHALEDRCPHRRVPLSLGRVTSEGTLQCGYHGWCYDGDTGRCVLIPNFRPGEPVSARVMARSYRVVEQGGLLFVAVVAPGAVTAAPKLSVFIDKFGAKYVRTADASMPIEHRKWVEALLDNPAQALGLSDICKLDEATCVEVGTDKVVIEQPVMLTGRHRWMTGVKGGDQLLSRCTVWATTGFTEIEVRDAAGRPLSVSHVASVPLLDGATAVRLRLCATDEGRCVVRVRLRSGGGHLEIAAGRKGRLIRREPEGGRVNAYAPAAAAQ